MSKMIPNDIKKKGAAAVFGWIMMVVIITFGLLALFGWVGSIIWNAVMPQIFGLPHTTMKDMILLWWLGKFLFSPISSNSQKE